ncbi:unnamed protein product [Polarella glacialis]|uniref:Uncharacterized protein n=1 Tax=Polarella glacialis TaxID=89957 RepID=A0A813L348_POLGL|nr:unnamed protein product [Polarella glacialis]CAE8716777.1 unnamed protein product [Polarella glacialis]|mmetsp:Transcript_42237/g.76374  ORF Transcript_42237/g.76374 Transcript_42237/m.76374 type:complete len:308 (-) Transcript_42237:128-1051(-)|eukprot:CAMPEP_0115088580 /NCGR_PEP_ID=MMETSP0227-20121206/24082_1 /TAXON_ID=89957 /ORGANISM="Polarella glacialis, Strain CCMP 1383" /LENGTH=307 /DNA_ID=CAMNT_0002478889 /DNA_START=60 /DNA_END=983 /DNA_ORIENTATION=-
MSNLPLKEHKEHAGWKAAKPFLTGSLAGMTATCFIQPVDMVKVRIQLAAGGTGGAQGPIEIVKSIHANEGLKGFYSGLSAALTRQVLYTGARLGLFDKFTHLAHNPEEKHLPFYKLAGCAMAAGGFAAVVGNPADLALVRMQSDSLLPAAEKRGYKNIGDALVSIVKAEGAMGLFGGVAPTVYRAMAQNFGMLAFNAKAKSALEHMEFGNDNIRVFTAAAIGGFAASVFALPFDYVKTQVQKMTADPVTGKMPYTGPLDCAMKQVKAGGPLVLYSGFPIFYMRMAPHAMISLIMQDQIKKLWKSMGL